MVSGEAPITVVFTDASAPDEQITSRLWNFGDPTAVAPNPNTTTETNPTHIFNSVGLYEVSETVSDGITSSTFTDQVLAVPSGQIEYWPLDEESGTRFEDVSGFNLTQNNNVLHAPGMFGTAALFDSTQSQYLSRAASGTELYPADSYTISLWIYPTGTAGNQYSLICKDSSSSTDRPFTTVWWRSFSGAIQRAAVTWTSSTGIAVSAVTAHNSLVANQWNHVAFGYSTADKKGRIWANGGTAVVSAALPANPVTTGTAPFFVGASNGSGVPARFFDGRIQEVRIFDRLLTDEEVAILATPISDAIQESESRPAQIMLDLSNDGGKTWIAQPWRSIGGAGQWGKRVRWNRLGAARRRVFQVSVTDPVPWKLTGAYLDDPNGGSGGR